MVRSHDPASHSHPMFTAEVSSLYRSTAKPSRRAFVLPLCDGPCVYSYKAISGCHGLHCLERGSRTTARGPIGGSNGPMALGLSILPLMRDIGQALVVDDNPMVIVSTAQD